MTNTFLKLKLFVKEKLKSKIYKNIINKYKNKNSKNNKLNISCSKITNNTNNIKNKNDANNCNIDNIIESYLKAIDNKNKNVIEILFTENKKK